MPRVVSRERTPRFIRANGLQFAYDQVGEGDRVALLLHGFPEGRFAWRAQLPALAGAGWRAVAVDLRGYGDSDRPPGRRSYRMARLVDDVRALFEALGARRRLLVGHDWGGAIAWAGALEGGLGLDGLVVMNLPHPAVFRRLLARSWAQRRRSWYMAAFQMPVLPEWALSAGGGWLTRQAVQAMARGVAAAPAERLALYRRYATRPGGMKAMVDYYRANAALMLGPTPVWPRLETPTLMIWGEEDRALGLELTDGHEPLVADWTLHRLAGVSHWVQQEAAEAVNAKLLRWMEEKGLA